MHMIKNMMMRCKARRPMSTGIENGQVETAAIIGRYGDPILVGIERLPVSALDVIVFAVHVPVVGHP